MFEHWFFQEYRQKVNGETDEIIQCVSHPMQKVEVLKDGSVRGKRQEQSKTLYV